MSNGKRVFAVAVLLDLTAFLAYFLYALFSYSANKIVPVFALRWELAEACHGFYGSLASLQFLALALALGSSKGKVEELVQSAILPTVVLSAIISAAALLGGPQIEAWRSSIESSSAVFGASLDEARSSLDSGDLRRARTELSLCQVISRKDPRVVEVEIRLVSAELKAKREALPQPLVESPQPKDPVAAKDYYLKALEFSNKGDQFSANWYAATALRLDPSYTDARRLAATSWEKLHARGADPGDKERAAFYARKLEGYSLLRSGDAVGAYSVFKELSDARHSDDPDVRRYLAESLSATEKAAFFKDEADDALASSLVPTVFFRVPNSSLSAAGRGRLSSPGVAKAEAGPLRMIAAKDAAWVDGALYFREFEYIEMGTKSPRALARSPYAKLIDGKVFLVCVERDSPANVSRPVWSAGPVSGPTNFLDLPVAAEPIYRALVARVSPSSLSLADAWKALGFSSDYGIDPLPVIKDLLDRSALPFASFTAAAIGALAGGRFRRRTEGPFPKGLYALTPIMAVAVVPIFLIANRLDELISAWSLRILPGLSSLVLAAGIRTLVLFLAVLLMAGARDVDGDLD